MAYLESLIIRDSGGTEADVTVANALKVDGSAVTQPISVSALPLPAGAATAANQVTEIASLASIDAGIPAGLGQTTMAASMPVVIASDQSTVPISGTVTVDTSLLATAAKQDAQTALLTTIDAGIPAALGQTTMSASMPVTMASDQSAIPITSTDIIEHLDSLIIAIRKATQTIYKPPYANEIGMVKVTPGGSTGALPVSGSVAITTAGGGLIDQTFMQYFQNKIMINTWHSQLITR